MKKHISLLLVMIMTICCSLTACATATENKSVNDVSVLLQINNSQMIVNGNQREIDQGRNTAPIVQNDRTLVPIRAIIESFGGNVGWDESAQTVELKYNSNTIKLTINSSDAYINDNKKSLDVLPQIIDGRTMLPIRFISEGFSLDVFWNEEYSTIAISNNQSGSSVEIPDAWKQKNTAPIANSGNVKVHFIDVGQGDAIFTELPNNETLLIDAGPTSGIVSNYIKQLGYSKITYVVATHPDADHISGMPEVLDTLSVKKFYMPEKEHTTKIFERMLNAVETNGCEAIYAEHGKTILNTSDISISFLAPVKDYSDNNNASAVVKLKYKNNSFLFTGDAEYKSESDMMSSGADVSADVLKVGHHGSSSSTSEAF